METALGVFTTDLLSLIWVGHFLAWQTVSFCIPSVPLKSLTAEVLRFFAILTSRKFWKPARASTASKAHSTENTWGTKITPLFFFWGPLNLPAYSRGLGLQREEMQFTGR